jgi:hypothetical protein
MLLETLNLRNNDILDESTRAAAATYWAPPKAKSFTAVLVDACDQPPLLAKKPYMNAYIEYKRYAYYSVTYFSTMEEGETRLTGTPGSY